MKKKAFKLFDIGRQTLYNWLDLKKEQVHLSHKNGYQKGHSHAIDAFRDYVDQHPYFTQDEMAQHYQVCKKTIGRAIKKSPIPEKKGQTNAERNEETRAKYLQSLNQIAAERQVFVCRYDGKKGRGIRRVLAAIL